MRTEFAVDRANCEWCMSETQRALLARPAVTAVHTSAVPGCIIVDHDGDDAAAIKAVIDRMLHGFDTASNGETIMTTTTSTEHATCPHHPPPEHPQ